MCFALSGWSAISPLMGSELRSLVIYHVNREWSTGNVREETGVVYVSDYAYDADDRTVRITGDVTMGRPSTDEAFFERLRGTSRIDIEDTNYFILDSENTISDDDM